MSDLPLRNADPKRREVYELADALLSGGATAEQNGRLTELVCNDAEARRHYLRFMHDSAALWQWGRDALGAEGPAGEAQGLDTSVSSIPPIIIDPGPVLRTPWFSLHPFVGSPLFCYAAATLITGAAILGGWLYKISHEYPLGGGPQPAIAAVAPPGQPPELVGRVTGMADCRWAGPQAAPPGTSAVALGQQYVLDAGLMEISYESGAKVILQGPCAYQVDSPSSGFLSLGRLTARVEKGAGGRGQGSEIGNQKSEISNPQSLIPNPFFSVRTPTATVTDLGTEFGVEVDRSGATRSHVFQGEVELRVVYGLPSPSGRGAGGEGRERVIPLRENESARVEAGVGRAVTLTRGTAQASGFARQLPRRVAIKTFNTGLELKEGDVDPHWQLVARSDQPQLKPQPVVVAQYEHWEVNVPEHSQWISIPGDLQSIPNNVTYTFRTTFELTGLQPGGAMLRGWFIADNHINAIRLNGQPVAVPEHDYNFFDRFHQFRTETGFVEGANTLEFDVFNGVPPDVLKYPSGPMGLRVELEGFYVSTDRGTAGTQDSATTNFRETEGNRQPAAASAGKENSAGGPP